MTLIDGARLATPEGIVDGWLETSGERIRAVGSGPPPRPAEVSLGGDLVVPGFVDVHVHGGAGGLYMSGDPATAVAAAEAHRRHGTTTTMASLVASDPATLTPVIAGLVDLVHDGLLAGIHLEGPFLAEARAGANNGAVLTSPQPEVVDGLLAAGRGAVRMVTIAPELPYALDAVRHVVDAGAVAALGHTEATYAETRRAIDAGATAATHLFNQTRPIHHREPGPVPALLEDERVTVEVICDGVHLHEATVRMVYRCAGARRVSLITDAVAAAATEYPDGHYVMGGLETTVANGISRLVDGGALAGSTLTMDRAFALAVQAGVSVEDAVLMTSSTPAALLGLSSTVGSLAPGFDADLVVLDDTLALRAVMAKGSWWQ